MIADKQTETDFIKTVLSIGEEQPGKLNAISIADGIGEGCFTVPGYWDIYSGAKILARRGEGVSKESLGAELGERLRGTVYSVWPSIPHTSGYPTLSGKLKEYATRRAADEIGKRIQEAAKDPSGALGQSLIQAASALQGAFSSDGSSVVNGKQIAADFLERLERVQLGQELSIPTGLAAWDTTLGGLPRKFVTLVGAYPGAFKSGLCASIAANVAASGARVGFFSLEDNAEWVAKRYVSSKTGIPVEDMAKRRLKQWELDKVGTAWDWVNVVMKNLEFDHRSGLTGMEIAATARYMVADKKCDLIIVDHIGEVRPPDGKIDKHEWLGNAFKNIRDVAKDTGCAVLCAAHLRRKEDNEEDIYRVPRMTDFSDSSALEKAARVALGLYQPRDDPSEVALRVLKQNEGSARGTEIRLKKRPTCALVE